MAVYLYVAESKLCFPLGRFFFSVFEAATPLLCYLTLFGAVIYYQHEACSLTGDEEQHGMGHLNMIPTHVPLNMSSEGYRQPEGLAPFGLHSPWTTPDCCSEEECDGR